MSDALHIDNAEAARLARELAKRTGESVSDEALLYKAGDFARTDVVAAI